jgi:hypothetical protein
MIKDCLIKLVGLVQVLVMRMIIIYMRKQIISPFLQLGKVLILDQFIVNLTVSINLNYHTVETFVCLTFLTPLIFYLLCWIIIVKVMKRGDLCIKAFCLDNNKKDDLLASQEVTNQTIITNTTEAHQPPKVCATYMQDLGFIDSYTTYMVSISSGYMVSISNGSLATGLIEIFALYLFLVFVWKFLIVIII